MIKLFKAIVSLVPLLPTLSNHGKFIDLIWSFTTYQPVCMPKSTDQKRSPAETKQKLVDATVRLILKQGFSATTVDQICADAGLTKGSFFHYFENKEAAGREALDWWGRMGTALYADAWKDTGVAPLDQLHRFFDIMIGFARNPNGPCTCVVGMLSQEMAVSHPAIREVCCGHLTDWTDNVAKMLAAAKKAHPTKLKFDPKQVAWFLNSVWQGSMLIGKTRQTPEMIVSNLQMARAYVDGMFGLPTKRATKSTSKK